jgi:hypothetical protein
MILAIFLALKIPFLNRKIALLKTKWLSMLDQKYIQFFLKCF